MELNIEHPITITTIWILIWVWFPIILWDYIPHEDHYGIGILSTSIIMISAIFVCWFWESEESKQLRSDRQWASYDERYEEE